MATFSCCALIYLLGVANIVIVGVQGFSWLAVAGPLNPNNFPYSVISKGF